VARQVVFTKSALRDLGAIPREDQARIIAKLELAAKDPHAAGEEKVTNSAGLYRVREGHYRAVYSKPANEILVALVGHRKDVYARLRRLR
jgi:mRNA-degrading endonuclease RelE of RelBE toxin-antitoxin system